MLPNAGWIDVTIWNINRKFDEYIIYRSTKK